jgi:hypothetical protein
LSDANIRGVERLFADTLSEDCSTLLRIEGRAAAFVDAWASATGADRDEVRAGLVESLARSATEHPRFAIAVAFATARRLSGGVELAFVSDVFALRAVVTAEPIVQSREEEVIGTQRHTVLGRGGALTQASAPPPPPWPSPAAAADLPHLALGLVGLLSGGGVAAVPVRLTWLSTLLAHAHEHFTLDHPEDLAGEQADAELDALSRMLVEVELLHDGLATFFAGAVASLGLRAALTPTVERNLAAAVRALEAPSVVDLPIPVDRGVV